MRLCFFGDSFVNGVGDPDGLGWVGRVGATARRRGHDLTVYNLGVRRETSVELARRWRVEVPSRLPAGVDGRLVFSFGVNDTTVEDERPRVSETLTVSSARAILGEAVRLCPTLMVGPPPVADAEQNRAIARRSADLAVVCRELAVPYLPVVGPLLESGVWLQETRAHDGAHPGAGGYAALAALVEAWPAWQAWWPRGV